MYLADGYLTPPALAREAHHTEDAGQSYEHAYYRDQHEQAAKEALGTQHHVIYLLGKKHGNGIEVIGADIPGRIHYLCVKRYPVGALLHTERKKESGSAGQILTTKDKHHRLDGRSGRRIREVTHDALHHIMSVVIERGKGSPHPAGFSQGTGGGFVDADHLAVVVAADKLAFHHLELHKPEVVLIGPRSNKLESVNILGLHFSGTIEPTRDRIYVIDKEVFYLGHLLEHLFHTRDIHYHTFIAIVTPGNPQRSTVVLGKSHVGRGEEVMNLIHHHKRAEYGSHTHSQLKSEQDSMDRERVGPTVTAGSLMELIAIGEQHDNSRHDKRHHCGRQGIDKEPPYEERAGLIDAADLLEVL